MPSSPETPGNDITASSKSIPTTPAAQTDLRAVRRARTGRRAMLAVIGLLVIGGLSSLLGAHTSTASASGLGYRMTLTYPTVTRPGLAIRWILVVEHPGGFGGQVPVATTSRYFNLFDFNNLDPVPSSQTSTATDSIWQFDPPQGDTLTITMDARVEPAQQFGRGATTSLLVKGVPVLDIRYSTRILP